MAANPKADTARAGWRFALICGAVVTLFLTGLFGRETWFFGNFLERLELSASRMVMDLGRKAEVREDIVFVGIDDLSINLVQYGVLSEEEIAADPNLDLMSFGYPFPRQVWGELAAKLLDAGARVVVFDMLFFSEGEGDEVLRKALDEHPKRVVVGAELKQVNYSESRQLVGGWTVLEAHPGILDPGGADDPRHGFVNFFDMMDGAVWEVFPFFQEHAGAPLYRSLMTATLEQIGEGERVAEGSRVGIRFPEFNPVVTGEEDVVLPYQPIPLYTLFFEKTWSKNFGDGDFFKDKVVVVGGSSLVRFRDEVDTPVGRIGGPQLHICALANALDGDYYAFAPDSWGAIIIILGGLTALAVAFFVRHPLVGVSGLFVISAFYVGVVVLVFGSGLMLNVAAPVSTLLLSGILCFGAQYAVERREKRRLRQALERYCSKELTAEVLARPEEFLDSLFGRRLEATVLFSDLRNFTTKSEGVDERELVHQLNEYLEAMVGCVFDNGGMVDKFIGDAVMAVWGTVRSGGVEADAAGAVAAALAMREKLAELNRKWESEDRPTHAFGIGINSGPVVFGNIGSLAKMELTVIGDAVNLASRLEGLTKKFGMDLLVSESVAQAVRGRVLLRPVATVVPKGKTEPVAISGVPARSADELDPAEAEFLSHYDEAYAAWCDGDLERATALFERCREERPADLTVASYLERIEVAAGDSSAMRGPLRITEK